MDQNQLVFLKPDTADGQAALGGSVKVVYADLDLTHGVALIEMPPIEYTNAGGQSMGSGFTGSSPISSPIVCRYYMQGAAMQAYQACVAGVNIGSVTIYQLVASGKDLTLLTTYNLENTYISKWFMEFDALTDQQTGDGIVVTMVLMYTALTTSQTQFDALGNATGKTATLTSITKQVSEMAG